MNVQQPGQHQLVGRRFRVKRGEYVGRMGTVMNVIGIDDPMLTANLDGYKHSRMRRGISLNLSDVDLLPRRDKEQA